MIFNTFGDVNNPAVIVMHGMCQDWKSMYDLLNPLVEKYFIIIPAMDGFYDNSLDFTSFADECCQIEKYILDNYDGKVFGFYGVSQGALLGCELLARNIIKVEKAFLDGTYIAHQGKLAGKLSARTFIKAKKNGGKLPKSYNVALKLMGLSEDDLDMLKYVYWKASDESILNNMIQNYTYHLNSEIAKVDTYVILCCGSKEPYAKKSHNILKKYLKNYKEIILTGYGHGQMFYKHSDELCKMIINEWK